MFFFAAPGWVTDLGAIFGALVATVTFFGIVARSRVGKWLGKQIFDDLEGWVQRISREAAAHALTEHKANLDDEVEERLDEMLPKHLGPILYELRTNGGGSFRDQAMARLGELARRMDRFATFMDESTMDRRDLRQMFLDQIARQDRRDEQEDDRHEH